jgi:hypothetical protein
MFAAHSAGCARSRCFCIASSIAFASSVPAIMRACVPTTGSLYANSRNSISLCLTPALLLWLSVCCPLSTMIPGHLPRMARAIKVRPVGQMGIAWKIHKAKACQSAHSTQAILSETQACITDTRTNQSAFLPLVSCMLKMRSSTHHCLSYARALNCTGLYSYRKAEFA